MNRRTILTGLLAAPFVIRTPGLLMPVRPFALHQYGEWAKLLSNGGGKISLAFSKGYHDPAAMIAAGWQRADQPMTIRLSPTAP